MRFANDCVGHTATHVVSQCNCVFWRHRPSKGRQRNSHIQKEFQEFQTSRRHSKFHFSLFLFNFHPNPFDSAFDHDHIRLRAETRLCLRLAFVLFRLPMAPIEQKSAPRCQFAPIRNQSHTRPRPQHLHTSQAHRMSRRYAFVQSDRSAGKVNKWLYGLNVLQKHSHAVFRGVAYEVLSIWLLVRE